MEDYRLDIIIDQGPQARSLRLNLPKVHLGRRDDARGNGKRATPFAFRNDGAARLLQRRGNAEDHRAQRQLVRRGDRRSGRGRDRARSRGTPRTANNLLRWVRDYVQVKAEGKITAELADRALAMLEIDRDGFDQWDKRIIETLIHKFNGGPVGLTSLAVAVGEEAGTIEEVNEPYLIMEGYIKRTPQGRVATANAYRKLGLKMPGGMQPELL